MKGLRASSIRRSLFGFPPSHIASLGSYPLAPRPGTLFSPRRPAAWPGRGVRMIAVSGPFARAKGPLAASSRLAQATDVPETQPNKRTTALQAAQSYVSSASVAIPLLRLQLDSSAASFVLKGASEVRVPSCRLLREFPGRVLRVDLGAAAAKEKNQAAVLGEEDDEVASSSSSPLATSATLSWSPAFRTAMVRLATEGIAWNGRRWLFFHGKPRETHCILMAVNDCDADGTSSPSSSSSSSPLTPFSIADALAWHFPPVTTSDTSNMSMAPSKFASRLDLALSKTVAVKGSESFMLRSIDDLKATTPPRPSLPSLVTTTADDEAIILTDGCGFISPRAISQCAIEEAERKALQSPPVSLSQPPPCACAEGGSTADIAVRAGLGKPLPEAVSSSFVPSAVQGRLGGHKGLWLVNPFLSSAHQTVCVRPSQRKIVLPPECSTDTQRQLEVLKLSHASGPAASLNLQLLMLLFSHGVTAEAVITLARRYAEDLASVLMLPAPSPVSSTAVGGADGSSGMEGGAAAGAGAGAGVGVSSIPSIQERERRAVMTLRKWLGTTTAASSSAGIGMSLMHPADREAMEMVDLGLLRDPETLKALKKALVDRRLPEMAQGLHVPLDKARRLFIVPDPTGLLRPGQVFLQISDNWVDDDERGFSRGRERAVIEGPVLLARNPCHHPDDLQLAEAVDLLALIGKDKEGKGGKGGAEAMLRTVARHTSCGLERDAFAHEWQSLLFPSPASSKTEDEDAEDAAVSFSSLEKVLARWKEALLDVVVLPASEVHCKRSFASRLSGGDYDGDTAFVTWEPLLVTPEVVAKKKAAEELAEWIAEPPSPAATTTTAAGAAALPLNAKAKAGKKTPLKSTAASSSSSNLPLPQLGLGGGLQPSGFDFSFLSSSASSDSDSKGSSNDSSEEDENRAPDGLSSKSKSLFWGKRELEAALTAASASTKAGDEGGPGDLLLSSLGPASTMQDFIVSSPSSPLKARYDEVKLPAWLALHYADSFKPDSPANLLGKATNLHLAWLDLYLEQRQRRPLVAAAAKTAAARGGAGIDEPPPLPPLTPAHESEPLELARLCSELVDAAKKGTRVVDIPQRLRNVRHPSYLWPASSNNNSSSAFPSSTASTALPVSAVIGVPAFALGTIGSDGEQLLVSTPMLLGGSNYRTTRPSNSQAAVAIKAVQALVKATTRQIASADPASRLPPFQQPHPVVQSAAERAGWHRFRAVASEHLAAYLKDVAAFQTYLKQQQQQGQGQGQAVPVPGAVVESKDEASTVGESSSVSSAGEELANALASKLRLQAKGVAEDPASPPLRITSWQELHERARARFEGAVREANPSSSSFPLKSRETQKDVAHALALSYYMAVWERHRHHHGGDGSGGMRGNAGAATATVVRRPPRQHPPPSFAWLVARPELLCALRTDAWSCRAAAILSNAKNRHHDAAGSRGW